MIKIIIAIWLFASIRRNKQRQVAANEKIDKRDYLEIKNLHTKSK